MREFQITLRPGLDGGGSELYPAYVEMVRAMPRPRRVFEWCSGPAFIGFALLANRLCDSLCLADVNPVAVECCRETIVRHGLGDRVTVYHSDNLAAIPRTERWDMVVGNPPHFDTTRKLQPRVPELIYQDVGWHLHRAFYAGVEPHLAPGGMILLLENYDGSRVSDFYPMIAAAGLELVYCEPLRGSQSYFLGSVRCAEVDDWRSRFRPPTTASATRTAADARPR